MGRCERSAAWPPLPLFSFCFLIFTLLHNDRRGFAFKCGQVLLYTWEPWLIKYLCVCVCMHGCEHACMCTQWGKFSFLMKESCSSVTTDGVNCLEYNYLKGRQRKIETGIEREAFWIIGVFADLYYVLRFPQMYSLSVLFLPCLIYTLLNPSPLHKWEWKLYIMKKW